ncbi:hypothetical protein F5Y12DRAFT_716273 [Xylaria sp. FL1777]|nr:hypothetical protein F5Y12DRAFT_716273 [Xylaria sp. FL1777]
MVGLISAIFQGHASPAESSTTSYYRLPACSVSRADRCCTRDGLNVVVVVVAVVGVEQTNVAHQADINIDRGHSRRLRSPEPAFEDFQLKSTTKSKGAVLRSVTSALVGNANILGEGRLLFTNRGSMTENSTVTPVPNFFDRVPPRAAAKRVRDGLNKIIIPTKQANVLVAPNFFLEAKGLERPGDGMATSYLPDTDKSIKHLHSIDPVHNDHNDLNPMNVVTTEDDTPIIIDLDICKALRTALQYLKRTYG